MRTFLIILLGFAALLFAAKMIYVVSTAMVVRSTRGALYVSTTRKRITACLDAVSAKQGDMWVDLGCGDGRVLRQARNRYGIKAVGYEINPLAYLKARVYCLFRPGIRIRMQNFFKADLSGADIVSCYLFPDVMHDLARKLTSELKPGAVIISFNFDLPGLAPEQVLRPAGSLHSDPIYIYRAPESRGRRTEGKPVSCNLEKF